jgi:hypothetical protein
MERLRRRPSSCSEEDEGWAAPVILPPLVQRVDEGLERRVASSPSPQHLVGWNNLLFHIISKQLMKSRADSAELTRCLGSVLLPSTCFGTLWSDGLRLLLLLVICGPFGLHSLTIRAYLGLSSLSTRTVLRTQDR